MTYFEPLGQAGPDVDLIWMWEVGHSRARARAIKTKH